MWISWEAGFFHSVSYWASETLDSTRPPEQLHLSGWGPLALSRGEGWAEWHSGPGSGLGRAAEGRGCPRSRPRSGLSNWPDLGVPTPTSPVSLGPVSGLTSHKAPGARGRWCPLCRRVPWRHGVGPLGGHRSIRAYPVLAWLFSGPVGRVAPGQGAAPAQSWPSGDGCG